MTKKTLNIPAHNMGIKKHLHCQKMTQKFFIKSYSPRVHGTSISIEEGIGMNFMIRPQAFHFYSWESQTHSFYQE